MTTYKMTFGEIISLEPDLAEIVINDGVELSLQDAVTMNSILKKHFQFPIRMLINKKHSYTYSFDAQRTMGADPDYGPRAVLVYNNASAVSTKGLIKMNADQNWDISLFSDRSQALAWLAQKRKKAS